MSVTRSLFYWSGHLLGGVARAYSRGHSTSGGGGGGGVFSAQLDPGKWLCTVSYNTIIMVSVF